MKGTGRRGGKRTAALAGGGTARWWYCRRQGRWRRRVKNRGVGGGGQSVRVENMGRGLVQFRAFLPKI